MAGSVEPRAFIDPDGFNNERIALPVSDRASHPFGIILDVARMAAPVRIDQPEGALGFGEDRNEIVALNDHSGMRHHDHSGGTGREASPVWTLRVIERSVRLLSQ